MKSLTITLATALWLLSLPAIASRSENITADQFGDQWPFTVESGKLTCKKPGAVVFTTPDGKQYGVNGLGKSDKRSRDLHEIWKEDTESETAKAMRKHGSDKTWNSVGPIIDRGLKLCD